MLGRVYPESTGASGSVIGGVAPCNKGGACPRAGAAACDAYGDPVTTAWRGCLLLQSLPAGRVLSGLY